MNHHDPTFDEVARKQVLRDCTGCRNHRRLWGLSFCDQDKWNGEENMRRCNDYRRESLRGDE